MLRMTMRWLLKVKQKMMMMLMMRIMVMKMKGITMQMMLKKALMMPVSNWFFYGHKMYGLYFIAYFNGTGCSKWSCLLNALILLIIKEIAFHIKCITLWDVWALMILIFEYSNFLIGKVSQLFPSCDSMLRCGLHNHIDDEGYNRGMGQLPHTVCLCYHCLVKLCNSNII